MNNYIDQFKLVSFDNPSLPNHTNSFSQNPHLSRLEQEQSLALQNNYTPFNPYTSMSYGIIQNDNELIHQNMKPMFRKASTIQTQYQEQNLSKRKVDFFTGSSNRPDWQHKHEHTPLFSPEMTATNIYGNQPLTDFLKSRSIPSKEKRNTLPFQQIKVGPGLGVGINSTGKFIKGSGDLFRPNILNVDDLRIASKPKVSYKRPIIHSGLRGTKGIIVGKITHKKPPKFKINKMSDKQSDFYKQLGYNIEAPPQIGFVDPFTLSKSLSRGLETSIRPGGMITGPSNSPSYNPNDKPDPTKRDLHNLIPYPGNLGSHSNSPSYNPNDKPDPTKRDLHNLIPYPGNLGSHSNSPSYNPNDRPDPTKRDLHNLVHYPGNLGSHSNSPSYNPNDKPDPTKRDLHNLVPYPGNLGSHSNSPSYNPNDRPDPTKRDLHNTQDFSSGIRSHDGTYSKLSTNNMLLNTNREFTSQTNYGGTNVGPSYISHTELVDKIQNNYSHTPQIQNQNISRLPFHITHTKTPFIINNRIDSLSYQNLNTNPFINNTQSVAS